MDCAFCKANIDDNSLYCDQCGQEILICPKCNKLGKGKMCTSDGTALVSMRIKTATALTSTGVSDEVSTGISQAIISDIPQLHLINKTLELDIKIKKDCVIGRIEGDFVDIFGKYPQVSGRHLQINFDTQKGWTVTDLNSTNGTKYNNASLKPMQPEILSEKSYLCVANIEFYVQITSKGLIGKTGTQRI